MKKLLNSLIIRTLTAVDKVKLNAYAKGDIAMAHKYAMLHLLWTDLHTLINKDQSFWKPDMLFKMLIYPMLVDAIKSYNDTAIVLLPPKAKKPKTVIAHAKKMNAIHDKEIKNCLKIARYFIEQFPEYYFKLPKLPK
jgi:hypothetical protein